MISIGCDHAGYPLLDTVRNALAARGLEYRCHGSQAADAPYDYPLAAQDVCRDVLDGISDKGILICGTGLGMSMAANKFPGIRAALCSEPYSARMAREHNNANILVLGARVVGTGLATDILGAFLDGTFLGGKHQARLDLITQIERSND